MTLAQALKDWLWPRVPAQVAEAYVLAQYERLRGMAPMLYIAIVLIIAGAIAGSPQGPVWIRLGVPALVVTICVTRMIVWLRRPPGLPTVDKARSMVLRGQVISALTAIPCSLWCLNSWALADPDRAIYFPLYMAMGTLSTAYCLSMLRGAATFHLAVGLGPIAMAMLLSGDRMAISAAASIIVTSGFLFALLRFQHDRFVELLVLQQRMVALSQTDPLTGLANRRALQDRLEKSVGHARGGHGPSVLLLDLDGFKPVNDRHGHAAGDEVLRQVAQRLSDVTGTDGIASRIGGDEFAVLVLPGSQRSPEAIGTGLLAALALPFEFEGHRLHVGASLGIAVWPDDGTTLDQLLRVADRALYRAKGASGDEAAPYGVHALRRAEAS
ncbi:diguanylate cyclase [Novosphingobium sp. TH158]|uniref:GGDEF domain-containing protein n=1 Tax=Novosphingobium sp. TH158 TaxID=2067455 RepID=UPI000C7B7CCB|nr:diguanylate cyclase [Novosphingobium sp. TH158]PLK27563.1 sensor domain-containing diguanylate cyclase [Novosphingobium sp. TH158]